jgi:EAL domain-containing protein (putative c-di-GMP-specific phosphodiesterase class I)
MPEELLEILSSACADAVPLSAGDLEAAIQRNELAVLYQPVAKRFPDGTWDISSMEALVRWNHPTKGVLAPDAFLSMGEQAGFMSAITDFVIQTAVQQLKAWRSNRVGLDLRVNISASLIADANFPDRLENLLRELELDPALLTLEVNETAMIAEHPDMFDIMTRLRIKNMNLAIDDFGIGYSSLTQLVRTPFNEMKIDTSLIMTALASREARIMVETLVDLAHKLNLIVCAEGVETTETLSFLDSIQCDYAQGYLISKAVAPADVPAAIESWQFRQKPVQEGAQQSAS